MCISIILEISTIPNDEIIITFNGSSSWIDNTNTAVVSQNRQAGYVVGRVLCLYFCNGCPQADRSSYNDIIYSITSGQNLWLHIDSTSGQLSLMVNAVNITLARYRVRLQCRNSIARNFITINVNRIDQNEFPPMFSHSNIERNISESIDYTGNPIIVDVNATDMDIGSYGVINYSIITIGAGAEPFSINASTGQIMLTAKLDYERQSVHQFIVTAENIDSVNTSIFVRITVVDEYDKSPQFLMSNRKANVSVNETYLPLYPRPPEGFLTVQCVDNDTDSSMISYAIDPDADPGPFLLDAHSGRFSTVSDLDYEAQQSYSLVVFCYDNSAVNNSGRATVNITLEAINEFEPKFAQENYSITINETSPLRTVILSATQVNCTDRDRGVGERTSITLADRYHSPDIINTFNIDYLTGEIMTLASLDYDLESRANYEFELVCTDDQGWNDTARVHIRVEPGNDNHPRFIQRTYHFNVLCTTRPDTTVGAVLAIDDDRGFGGELFYTILNQPNEHFMITNNGSLLLVNSLREHCPDSRVTFEVVASDGTHMDHSLVYVSLLRPLSITNSTITVFINEEVEVGTLIAVVEVISSGIGTLNFRFENQSAPGVVFIDPTTGHVTTSASLDRESISIYTMTVIVTEQHNTPGQDQSDRAEVIIYIQDANDNSPTCSQAMLARTVTRNFPIGEPIITLNCSDSDIGDNGAFEYSLQNNFGVLSISASGIVFLEHTLYSTDRDILVVQVTVRDFGSPHRRSSIYEATIFIRSSNENTPRFLNLPNVKNVSEALPTQEIIFIVEAEDSDEGSYGEITYRIVNPEESTPFGIIPYTGQVFLMQKLNYFRQQVYRLIISAEDSDYLVTELLTINVLDANEYAPICESYIITDTIPENMLPPQILATPLSCSDDDAGSNGVISYTISEAGNNSSSFEVLNNGSVRTLVRLDFETLPRYELLLTLSDNGSPTRFVNVFYTVVVEPVNEFTPRFERRHYTWSISEAAQVGNSIISITATDNDSGSHPHGRVLYSLFGLHNSVFSISDVGVLRLAANLDREMEDSYELMVVAADQGVPPRSSVANVSITITDVDDNSPEFTEHFYTTTLNGTTEVGTLVSIVQCNDRDIGDNAAVLYSLDDSSQDSRLFRIDSITGNIYVNGILPISRVYAFNVICTGLPPESRSDMAVFSVQVIVDSSITFLPSSIYQESVREDTVPGNGILTISANSPTGATITYKLLNETSRFNIEPTAGTVYLTSLLDFETTPVYFLHVEAGDNGDPLNKAGAIIQINVINANDERPHFGSRPLSLSLDEGLYNHLAPPLTIGYLTCTDADHGVFGQVRFQLVGGNADGPFRVTTLGALQVVGDLDYETRQSYSLEVVCEDGGAPPKSDSAIIPINVLPINDNSPNFGSTTEAIAVSEALPIGSTLGDPVVATDNDRPPHNNVRYSILSGNTEPPTFTILVASGQLVLLRTLDFESVTLHTLVILAEDSGGILVPDYPVLNATITVQIDVEDFNDNRPTFSMIIYSGSVDEIAAIGDEVTLDSPILCTDMDSGMRGTTTLSLRSDKFSIQGNQIIVSTGDLDFEEQRIYFLTVVCQDRGEPSLSSEAYLNITLRDIDEFSPQFNHTPSYHFSVLERTPVGTLIGQVTATDKDGGEAGIIAYNFSNSDNTFSIDSYTGIIFLAVSLDYETRSEPFHLHVSASDTFGNSDITTVTIDTINEDDNLPRFTQGVYYFSILENSPEESTVGQVSCSDADDSADGLAVTYTLTTTNVPFGIQDMTGTVISSGSLDFEQSASYTLEVQCSDFHGNTVSANVSVQLHPVNDFPPIFVGSPYSQSVQENSIIGTSVYQVIATDDDSGQYNTVSFRIISSNVDNPFSIDSTTGIVHVSNSIDREVLDRYVLTIEAFNGDDTHNSQSLTSTATLSITIIDQNDNSPSIIPENPVPTILSESNGPSTVVAQLLCTDPDLQSNGSVFFSISSLSESIRNSFDILENGTLITTSSIQTNVVVDVTCSDKGTPPRSTTVSIIVYTNSTNSHAPVFDNSLYTLFVDEVQPVGVDIMCYHATDLDGPNSPDGIVDYSLHLLSSSANSVSRFSIRRTTGCVFVAIELDISYYSYLYSIVAMDRGSPRRSTNSSLMITIRDVIHDAPMFTNGSYTLTVPETIESGTELVTVVCTDQDINDNISYSITSNNEDSLFSIGQGTGVLRISSDSMLDYEQAEFHTLSIRCTDRSGLYDTNMVFITVAPVNEFSPTLIDPNTFIVAEDSERFTNITRLQWIDNDGGLDGKVTFQIISGNVDNAFVITRAGDILMNGTLDREMRDFYALSVRITDQSQTMNKSSMYPVNITVTDSNDNAPIFHQDFYIFGPLRSTENVGSHVGSVSCSDEDIDSNAQVTYQIDTSYFNGPSLFRVNPINGDITLANDLTQRSCENVTFIIECTDGGAPHLSDHTRVLVVIEEAVRNPPEFTESSYYVEVPEDTRIIQDILLRVQANVSDTGIGGRVQYYLQDNIENLFFLDKDTGDLSLLRPLDFEERAQYILMVEAKDGAVDSLLRQSSIVEVTVNVSGVNEFTPECVSPIYVSIINRTTQGTVLNFNCIDHDEGVDGHIIYSFHNGNEMDQFEISSNGDLIIPSVITVDPDIEQLELTITVSDLGFPQRSTNIEVILLYTSENTYAPVFEAQLNFNASELLKVGTVIGQLRATDQDNGIQGLVTYTVMGTDSFLVDPESGELYLSRSLDWETESLHTFTATATDSDLKSPQSTSVLVTVNIINENDNRPFCDQQFYFVQISSSVQPSDTVTMLNCSDPDGTSLQYAITSQNNQSSFSVNSTSGEVYVSSILTSSQTVIITVQVSGEGDDSVEVSVGIQVLSSNIDPPAFTQAVYTFSISEDTPIFSTIGTLFASDPDSKRSDLTFMIEDSVNYPEFYLNPNTGEVTLTSSLDFESQQQYSFGVIVKDAGSYDGSNQLSNSATVVVMVLNTNDNKPLLSSGGIYSINVSVTSPVGTTVLSTTCIDNDSPPFALPFISSTGFSDTPFTLVSILNGTAMVEVASSLSPSTAYSINITCQDADGVSVDGQVLIFVPEPSAPSFIQPIYEWSVPENEEPGTEYSHIVATSNDGSNISYTITDGNADNIFHINTETGLVSLLASLDYETQHRYGLVVTAADSANRQSSVLLLVYVINVDEPSLRSPSALLHVSQNAHVGLPIGTLNCTDRDSGIGSASATLNFTFVPSSELFSVDMYGVVRVTGILNHTPVYVLGVMCSDPSIPRRVAMGVVTIEVEFVNLHQPQFVSDTYNFLVREDARPLSFVGQVSATDGDVGSYGEISYAITDGNSNKFYIDASSGSISVLSPLDRETEDFYVLTVTALDGGISASESSRMTDTSIVSISVLDVNDNPPTPDQFSYVQSILTNHTVMSPVLHVQCRDPDLGMNADIAYSLQPPELGAFTIESNGDILLTQEQSNKIVFNFFTICTDRGTPSLSSSALVTVAVDYISVTAPVFDQEEYKVSIFENETLSSTILRVYANSSDPSIGIVYSLLDGNENGTFYINQFTGDLQLISLLDASIQQNYSITVEASTTGHTLLSSQAVIQVMVVDVNNNKPFFTPSFYLTSINESSNLFMPVTQLACQDKDVSADISYTISNNESVPFNITKEGLIFVAGEIDYEIQTFYSLRVVCHDGGNVPMFDTTEVRIDILPLNEFVPQFSMPEYRFEAPEYSFGLIIGWVQAEDGDSGSYGEITYLLQDQGNFSIVLVDPLSGEVLVATNLDYEEQTSWNFTVIAKDAGGAESYAYLHINVLNSNDVYPVIVPFTAIVNITSDLQDGYSIQSFSCVDADGSSTSLIISSGDTMGYFQMNGNVLVWNGIASNLTSDIIVTLTIRCEDADANEQFANGYIAVHIQAGETEPLTFAEDEYAVSIAENSPIGTSVVTVSAVGPNPGSIRYHLLNLPAASPFQLHSDSGNIILMSMLDRETVSLYTVTVQAIDLVTGAVRFTTIQIIIEDFNDNAPVVTPASLVVSLQEDLAPTVGFFTFTCTDKDLGPNGEIGFALSEGNVGMTFAIDESGLISLNGSLDFESIAMYNITVQCRDANGLSDTAQLTVVVTGINEYTPQFENSTYRFSVHERLQAGELVGTVMASDWDDGRDGVVSYSVISEMGTAYFTVNVSGHIHKNIRPLNGTATPEIQFMIRASDGRGRFNDTRVIVEVKDINEPPMFADDGNYFVTTTSNLTIGSLLLDFLCFDTDVENNASLILEMFTVAPGLNIRLQSLGAEGVIRGSLTTNSTLVPGSYEVVMLCTDRGEPSLTSMTTTTVRVEEINEAPMFLHNTQALVIPEDETVGTMLITVNATDKETDVFYQVTGGDGRGTFDIDNMTGTISLALPLDYETKTTYQMTVTAYDQSITDQKSATTTVNVTVDNVNDNVPVLHPPGDRLTIVSETAPSLYQVKSYICIDPDGGDVNLTLATDYPDSPFFITQINSSAQVYLQRSLDYDLQSTYRLTVMCTDSEIREKGPILWSSVVLGVSVKPVNVHPPEFNSTFMFSISEDAAIGDVVGKIEAFDLDGRGVIAYSSASHIDLFVVDSSTGIISLAGTLDHESTPVYFMTVIANDNDNTQGLIPLTSNTTVTVLVTDTNDNPPSCLSTTINVELGIGSHEYEPLATLYCSDDDTGENGELFFEFLEDSLPPLPEGMFLLNESTGELAFRGNSTTPTTHVISITVSDTGDVPLTTVVNVVVHLISTLRPHFEPNTFSVNISENTLSLSVLFSGSTLLESLIKPYDANVRFTMRPDRKYSNIFTVDSLSGNVTITNNELLDYDGLPDNREYNLVIDAIVGTDNATALVLISILDFNDNKPQFTRGVYSATVFENEPTGTFVLHVEANDLDSEENGLVLFTIQDTIGFTINPTSGNITTLREFDREANECYTFVVIATDMGSPSLTASALVTVTVGDINDQVPSFVDSVYVICIDELSLPGTRLLQFEIEDEDSERNFAFQIVSDNQDVQHLFTIDSSDGTLCQRAIKIPDDHLPRYNFTVKVHDGFATDSTQVIIHIASTTHDTVMFEENILNQVYNLRDFLLLQEFNITEFANYNIEEGDYSESGYYSSGFFEEDKSSGIFKDTTHKFDISSRGILTTIGTLDREATDQYDLRIRVTDPISSTDITVYVTVHVIDQNDNAPLFSQDRYTFNISEGTYSVAQLLGRVVAVDDDQPGNGASTIEYSIVGAITGQSDVFNIDPDVGDFFLSEGSVIDRENNTNHTILVRGRDFGEPTAESSLTYVFVTIEDINDNDPEFDPLDVVEYFLFIPEGLQQFSNLTNIVSILPGGIQKNITEIKFMDRDSTSEVTATLRCKMCALKYNLTRVSDYSVVLVSTDIISMEDNATVLEVVLFDDPEGMEDSPVIRTITVVVDEGGPSTEPSTENPESTKPIDFFDTEVGIAVLTIICSLIAGLMLVLSSLLCYCIYKIRQESDPLKNV